MTPDAAEERPDRETATLGGGCFWCLEAVFERLAGVEEVLPGYAGGHVADPDYAEVCTGRTGHAEVVRITFDPERIGYRDLLDVFFTIHDPTTLNRQGGDVGTQYRSVILHESPEQARVARETIEALEAGGGYDDPVVTQVEPLETFYPAEVEHQEYYRRNPAQPYCRVVIDPKLRKLEKRHQDKLRA
ncbi:MAG TPA: peptide-methionine (S)-S-oxide reductase MsrA [Longimicrobiales bacterium]|nr:peptide-methionine (S)-S-oxide reductase MsrA [Longimicrobiales bacterium]